MKRTIVTVLATLAFVGLAMLVVGHRAQPVNTAVAVAAPAPSMVPMPSRCPNIHAALDGLRSAEQELHDAAHDFCGHRVAAMESVHHAIEQLRAAEGCARCR